MAGRRRLRTGAIPGLTFLRTALFGLVAIVGATAALVRHCTYELPPMRVPVSPRAVPTYDVDAGELPVPEILVDDGGR